MYLHPGWRRKLLLQQACLDLLRDADLLVQGTFLQQLLAALGVLDRYRGTCREGFEQCQILRGEPLHGQRALDIEHAVHWRGGTARRGCRSGVQHCWVEVARVRESCARNPAQVDETQWNADHRAEVHSIEASRKG